MTEKDKEDKQTEDTEQVVEHTVAEEKALKNGWNPDWEGPEDEKFTAAEYNRRAEFIGKIISQNKRYDRLEKQFGKLTEHHRKVAETTKEQTIKELMEKKTEAYAQEDFKKVVDIDQQIKQTEDDTFDLEIDPQKAREAAFTEQYEQWVSSNTWYTSDTSLRADADAFGASYLSRYPDAQPEEVFAEVDKKMRKYLTRPNSGDKATTAVERANKSSGKTSTKKKTYTETDLSKDQLELFRGINRVDDTMTIEKYTEELAKIGEL